MPDAKALGTRRLREPSRANKGDQNACAQRNLRRSLLSSRIVLAQSDAMGAGSHRVGSVLFDAVFVPGGQRSVEALCADANAVLFVKEAYKHGKAIAASDEGATLIARAAHTAGTPDGKFQGPGIIAASGKSATSTFVRSFVAAIAKHRFPERPDLNAIVA